MEIGTKSYVQTISMARVYAITPDQSQFEVKVHIKASINGQEQIIAEATIRSYTGGLDVLQAVAGDQLIKAINDTINLVRRGPAIISSRSEV